MTTHSEQFRKLAESEIGLDLEAALRGVEEAWAPLGEATIAVPDINNVAGYSLVDGSVAVMLRLSPITVARMNTAWQMHQMGDTKATIAVERLLEQIVIALNETNRVEVDEDDA